MNSFTRWLRSKQGMTTLGLVVVLVLIVAIVGTQTDLFGAAGGSKKATVTNTPVAQVPATNTSAPVVETPVPPTVSPLQSFAAPKSGYSCLPTCETNDGKFLVLAGMGMSSFGGNVQYLWVAVPGNASSFELSIFDGDGGKDNLGGYLWSDGNWDYKVGEVTYSLFADPNQTSDETQPVASWKGNADNMPNNAWWSQTLPTGDSAKGPDGNFYYLLKVEKDGTETHSSFKLRTTGYLSAGRGDLVGTSLGLRGGVTTRSDIAILFPEFAGDYQNPGPSLYTGDWTMFFYVPENVTRIELWDGDFDRGDDVNASEDSDDFNTEGVPAWSLPGVTVPEGAGGVGRPRDDSPSLLHKRSPAVTYEVLDPSGNVIATNDNPSGTEEWEKFVISSDPAATDADKIVASLPSGQYIVHIKGLDGGNAVWFYADMKLCDPDAGCPGVTDPPPTPTEPPITTEVPTCSIENYNLGGGAAIIALNPADCQGQQNGLLFHGTSSTTIIGDAYSAGCLRSVGTHSVTLTEGLVEYIGPEFGNMSLISPAPVTIPEPLPESSWKIAAPDCSDPAAHNVDAKDWKGDVTLEAGLYCVSGDVKINANETFIGKGVTIYLVNGSLTINGGATVQLTSPFGIGDVSVSPALNNVLFYVPGENGNGQKVQINGNSDSYFEGVVYAPGSEIEVLGTGQVNAPYRSQFIGWDVRVGGTADLFINWKGSDLPACVP